MDKNKIKVMFWTISLTMCNIYKLGGMKVFWLVLPLLGLH